MSKQSDLIKTLGRNPGLIRPLGNTLIIDLFRPEEQTDGGLFLPDQVRDKDRQSIARVVAVGQGQRSITTGEYMTPFSKAGDLVVIMKHAPFEVTLGGEKCYAIFEGDVIGIIDEEKLLALIEEQEAAEAAQAATEAAAAPEPPAAPEAEPPGVTELPSGLLLVQSKE